jgi:tRNA G10  N-methylase Trm11
MERIRPIHPFAARMAPEIAFAALRGLEKNALILDPMSGSGTVMRTISELGFRGLAFDIDPLAVMMSGVWTAKVSPESFKKELRTLLNKVSSLSDGEIRLPWIDEHIPTQNFIAFWYAPAQIRDLRKLSYQINIKATRYAAVFKLALSRLIITKTTGASLAADISHSRPHKVRVTNDFDVLSEFERTCAGLLKMLCPEKLLGNVAVKMGDARRLTKVKSNSVDLILTSPPYLNALDYMRGHRLSLVWLGHRLDDLSAIRSSSVGAERAPDIFANIPLAEELTLKMQDVKDLPAGKRNMIYRYALDMNEIMKESARVLKKGKHAVFVIGNSTVRGVRVENTLIAEGAAIRHGLQVVEKLEREIPQNKRYLPPPSSSGSTGFDTRMRTETVITFRK